MSAALAEGLIAVNQVRLETLIAEGRISSADAMLLSPELHQVVTATQARELEMVTIKNATGKLEVDAGTLATLCLFAEGHWWLNDADKHVYAPMCEVKTLLLARGRGES